jgi:hypothetical protein
MVQIVIAVLALIGATVINVWLGRLNWIPQWLLVVIWTSCYAAIAGIYFRARFSAAYQAFTRRPQSGPSEVGLSKTIGVEALSTALHPFRLMMGRVENAPEMQTRGNELRSALGLAGWQTSIGDLIIDPRRFSFTGVKIVVHEKPLQPTDRAPLAAIALAQELERQHILVTRQTPDIYFGRPEASGQANFIRLVVGSGT